MSAKTLIAISLALLCGCASRTHTPAVPVVMLDTAFTVPYDILPGAPEPATAPGLNPFGPKGLSPQEDAFRAALLKYEVCMKMAGASQALSHQGLLLDSPAASKLRTEAADYCDPFRQEAARFGRIRAANPGPTDGLLEFGHQKFDAALAAQAEALAHPGCTSAEDEATCSRPEPPIPLQ